MHRYARCPKTRLYEKREGWCSEDKMKTSTIRMNKFGKYISSFVKVRAKGINMTIADKKK